MLAHALFIQRQDQLIIMMADCGAAFVVGVFKHVWEFPAETAQLVSNGVSRVPCRVWGVL